MNAGQGGDIGRVLGLAMLGAFSVSGMAHANPTDELSPNAVYAELGGSALLYTVNYERLVTTELSIRAGFSYDSVNGICGHGTGCTWIQGRPSAANYPNATLWQFPITLSYLGFRRGRHVLELGGGGAVTYVGNDGAATRASGYLAGFAGYRFHPIDRTGFLFRAGLSLAVGDFRSNGGGFLPWPYTSLGVAF